MWSYLPVCNSSKDCPISEGGWTHLQPTSWGMHFLWRTFLERDNHNTAIVAALHDKSQPCPFHNKDRQPIKINRVALSHIYIYIWVGNKLLRVYRHRVCDSIYFFNSLQIFAISQHLNTKSFSLGVHQLILFIEVKTTDIIVFWCISNIFQDLT